MILYQKYLHILVMIPHSQVASIGYQVTRLIMNRQALVIFVIACLLPAHDLAHHAESEIELSTMPGGTPISFHVERFGSTSHITLSIPMVEASSHVRPRPSVSNPMWIPEPRRVNIGNTTYIPSHVPLSLNPTPSNAFLTTLPPPHSHVPSG